MWRAARLICFYVPTFVCRAVKPGRYARSWVRQIVADRPAGSHAGDPDGRRPLLVRFRTDPDSSPLPVRGAFDTP